MVKLICIGHKPPLFEIAVPYRMLAPVPLALPGVEVIPDDVWGAGYDGRVLSEFLQLFVLADLLDPDDDEPIYLFQYRKFVVPQWSEHIVGRYEVGHICKPDGAARAFPSAAVLQAASPPTTGRVLRLDVAAHYATYHHPADFACFGLALADSGRFSPTEVVKFVRAQHFIPSAALGLYRASMLVRHLRIMRQVWDIYRERYFVPREGYQVRVGGYLLERLHSFLLLLEGARDAGQRITEWERVMVVP